ncbi:MAG: S-methyl-5-thioribose-1-phosphate isomerase [Desulfurococcaceae archaeon]
MEPLYPQLVKALWFDESEEKLCWINTNKLPFEEEVICSNDPARVASAIKNMEIRGAPAIGVAAALVLGAYALKISEQPLEKFIELMNASINTLAATRPTAYNLFYALNRIRKVLSEYSSRASDARALARIIVEEAIKVYREDVEANIRIGEVGSELVPDGATIMTHCNAGALATSAYGTALAVIRVAFYKGKRVKVIATETRPVLQGARLTVYELVKEGIPVTLITDNAAGLVLKKKMVDLVIVGADRITKEGYVINKIGTYMIALAAKRNQVPFYVAAPISTIDLERSVDQVVIEERDPAEVKYIRGVPITLDKVSALNYAFDITDPDLVTAIITERGIAYPPYSETLSRLVASSRR